MPSRTASSESGYAKLTFSKTSSKVFGAFLVFALSLIRISSSRTSLNRLIATFIRGIDIKIIESITNAKVT